VGEGVDACDDSNDGFESETAEQKRAHVNKMPIGIGRLSYRALVVHVAQEKKKGRPNLIGNQEERQPETG
jgi:hypothetical protein